MLAAIWISWRSTPLQWRHNGHDSVSNHQPHECLLKRLFRRRSKKTSKLRATGLCVGNSPGTGEFPAQMASNAYTFSIWWRHHAVHSVYEYCRGLVQIYTITIFQTVHERIHSAHSCGVSQQRIDSEHSLYVGYTTGRLSKQRYDLSQIYANWLTTFYGALHSAA